MKIFRALLTAALMGVVVAQFGLGGGGLPSTLTDSLSKAASLFTKQFGDFKNKFKKQYSNPQEEKKRLDIFSQNQKSILDLSNIGNLPYTLKVNQFADLLPDEFNKLINGFRPDRSKSHGQKFTHPTDEVAPENIDWRERGGVTPAKSQGICGSCYAFAATGALEGHLFRKNGNLVELSPQNVMDCTQKKPYENYGCTSGSVDPSFDYIKDNGINLNSEYPYEEKVKECRFKQDGSVANVKGYILLDENDEKGLEEAVATKGPVAVGIDAHAKSFQFYGGGLYYEPHCSASIDRLNHAVLVIGYGTQSDGQKYWLIKNSYGPEWGENGFAKILRNVTNPCGLATYALYPDV